MVFCGLIRDVQEFLEAVNKDMTLAELRHALSIGTWLTTSEVEKEDETVGEPESVRWTSVTIDVEELKREAVVTTMYLVRVLDSLRDWRDLVDDKAHGVFERKLASLQAHLKEEGVTEKLEKALLAPKGQYWDTSPDKVLKMFRTTIENGLNAIEVQRRREVYGDYRAAEIKNASTFMILVRQLSDLIVVILIVGKWAGGHNLLGPKRG